MLEVRANPPEPTIWFDSCAKLGKMMEKKKWLLESGVGLATLTAIGLLGLYMSTFPEEKIRTGGNVIMMAVGVAIPLYALARGVKVR